MNFDVKILSQFNRKIYTINFDEKKIIIIIIYVYLRNATLGKCESFRDIADSNTFLRFFSRDIAYGYSLHPWGRVYVPQSHG